MLYTVCEGTTTTNTSHTVTQRWLRMHAQAEGCASLQREASQDLYAARNARPDYVALERRLIGRHPSSLVGSQIATAVNSTPVHRRWHNVPVNVAGAARQLAAKACADSAFPLTQEYVEPFDADTFWKNSLTLQSLEKMLRQHSSSSVMRGVRHRCGLDAEAAGGALA
jgi:hypothetical protein